MSNYDVKKKSEKIGKVLESELIIFINLFCEDFDNSKLLSIFHSFLYYSYL